MIKTQVRIDRSFWLLPTALSAWVAVESGPWDAIRMFVLVLAIFLCVLAHEFCHGWRAISLGVPVPTITLYPMGGVAAMLRIPREPWQEFTIALAGPAFNFVLAAALYFPLLHLLGREDFFSPGIETWPRTLANAYWANPALGLFNLIPAFPMDGGRILRSLLALRLPYLRATLISVLIGRVFAILFFLLGLWKHQWMLALVGGYVYVAAGNELRQVQKHVESTENSPVAPRG